MKRLSAVLAALLASAGLAAHAVGTQADISIFDRTTGRELPVYWHDGQAYVVGKPGNEYKVVARNRSGESLLAVVAVDGVNAISGQTASLNQAGYIVAPWSTIDVQGWRKSMDQIASFYFTSLGDSYAARTDRPSNVGVIGVALFRQRAVTYEYQPPVEAAPQVEPPYFDKRSDGNAIREKSAAGSAAPQAKRALPAPSAPLGTGHGRREDAPMRWTEFVREDRPVEIVNIFYDSYRNLVAMGVIRSYYARPSQPQSFPGAFVADPYR